MLAPFTLHVHIVCTNYAFCFFAIVAVDELLQLLVSDVAELVVELPLTGQSVRLEHVGCLIDLQLKWLLLLVL